MLAAATPQPRAVPQGSRIQLRYTCVESPGEHEDEGLPYVRERTSRTNRVCAGSPTGEEAGAAIGCSMAFKGWPRFVGSINRVFRTLAVGRNAEVGRPQRGAQRRAHVAGGHQTFAGRRQVHTPARVRSGAAGRARARPQKMAQHARACVCSPGARGRSAGAGGRVSACPMRGRAVHMAAGVAPLLRRARRAAVRDGHSRRAWASQTRCGPLGL